MGHHMMYLGSLRERETGKERLKRADVQELETALSQGKHRRFCWAGGRMPGAARYRCQVTHNGPMCGGRHSNLVPESCGRTLKVCVHVCVQACTCTGGEG